MGISRPGLALRSAIVPVPGVSRFGTLGAREAGAEEEAVVGSTDDTKNDLLAVGTAGGGSGYGQHVGMGS